MGPVNPHGSYNYNTQGGMEFEVPEPTEIVIEGEGDELKVFRIIEKMVPKKVKEEMPFRLFDGKNFGEFLEWMTALTDDELEAARQIYFDIWNFKSGSGDDKARFELIEGEQNKRQSRPITFTGGSVTFTAGSGAGGAGGGVVGVGGAGGGGVGFLTSK